MAGWEIGFDKPWYLTLLVLVPLLWLFSYRSLGGLGRIRRVLALLLRTSVVVLIVLALAEIQLLRTSDKVTVIYLLDQSESIPLETRQSMIQYVTNEVAAHRRDDRRDRAGVIVFGRSANIEIPPFDDDVVALGGIESYFRLRTDATNLEAALKLAKASFPEDTSKRVVLVTDGNENVGDVRSILNSLAEDGIGIDVAPVLLESRAEVSVEKVVLPSDIRLGQPVDLHVVLENHAAVPVRGKLKVVRRIGPQEQLVTEETVELPPGKTPFRLPEKIEQAAVFTYQADFFPENPADDLMVQNNRASAFTHVRGKGHVLLIVNWEEPNSHDHLVNRLRASDIEVTVTTSDRLYSSLAELQAYDCVILGDVPRSSGADADSVKSFSDAQVSMLVRNVEQMGCGLVMLGGPNSFGVGGWSNTELEKAMPVDFQINNSKIRAVGALALMMHASEIAEGNYWQKEVAKQAINALGPMDYCGLLHWDGTDRWLWGDPRGIVQVGESRSMMVSRLGRMTPGDMPEFGPSMRKALVAFNRVPASVKMMIVISDGDPSEPPTSLLNDYSRAGVMVTTVAVGAHGPAGHQTLQKVANATGGNYYVVRDPRALPRIYQAETRRVAKPLIHENDAGIGVQIVGASHEILQGINAPPPPISGLVMTTLKENPLVEVALLANEPADERNATLLATWTYGLGRTAVVTTDVGTKWAASWTNWENYTKLMSQLVRWAMRPVNETDKFSIATQVKDGKVLVVITALNKDDEFLNFLNMSGAAIDPDLQDSDVKVQQVAPGRYVAEFDATKEGNYFINVHPGAGHAPLLTGVNVPYSAEFRERESNLALIQAMARTRPRGGQSGQVLEQALAPGPAHTKTDTFRGGLPPAVSSQDVWPLTLVIMSCVFFADVLIRRVTVSWQWLPALVARLRGYLRAGRDRMPTEERLDQLRSRKAAIADKIDERRAATRFEPVADSPPPAATPDELLRAASGGGAEPKRLTESVRSAEVAPEKPEAESYTARLLKAKQQAKRDEGRT
ncbi:MAG: glutamine amidotransferase [Pirellulaceae bacterium]